ncbi:hypothetical protein DFP72DRAFT_851370 [Ephemerocybe angulata]|uniref:Uncharacterized protein n=1 Tax=Ephemerocybe angulata TaxID=980116 RepID=A0A8H6M463_9AGAR|nr:hypothetical protein DFP72DRAFT_851370 [Tulosesus angulatus]
MIVTNIGKEGVEKTKIRSRSYALRVYKAGGSGLLDANKLHADRQDPRTSTGLGGAEIAWGNVRCLKKDCKLKMSSQLEQQQVYSHYPSNRRHEQRWRPTCQEWTFELSNSNHFKAGRRGRQINASHQYWQIRINKDFEEMPPFRSNSDHWPARGPTTRDEAMPILLEGECGQSAKEIRRNAEVLDKRLNIFAIGGTFWEIEPESCDLWEMSEIGGGRSTSSGSPQTWRTTGQWCRIQRHVLSQTLVSQTETDTGSESYCIRAACHNWHTCPKRISNARSRLVRSVGGINLNICPSTSRGNRLTGDKTARYDVHFASSLWTSKRSLSIRLAERESADQIGYTHTINKQMHRRVNYTPARQFHMREVEQKLLLAYALEGGVRTTKKVLINTSCART